MGTLALVAVAGCVTSDKQESAARPRPSVTEAAQVIDLYFQAYASAIPDQPGVADPALWREANQRGGAEYLVLVHDALDAAFGWDFSTPIHAGCTTSPDPVPGKFRFTGDAKVGLALLEQVRIAVRYAIEQHDSSLVASYMMPFWVGPYGSYVPSHVGRCYPHGHVDFASTYGDARTCVAEHVGSSVELFLYESVDGKQGVRDIAQLASNADPVAAPVAQPKCNCYFDKDCGSPKGFRGICAARRTGLCEEHKIDGKLQDGSCTWLPDLPPVPLVDFAVVAPKDASTPPPATDAGVAPVGEVTEVNQGVAIDSP